MVLTRTLEDRIASLYRAGDSIVGGVYLGRGQEAFSAALGASLSQSDGDIFAGLIRDMAGRLAFGEALLDPARTYLGSVLGPMRGRDGNIHRGRPKEGLPAMISHLGSLVSVVNGMLLARRLRNEPMGIGATCVGDGATSTGSFHEAMNMAAVERLPLVVGVANNQFAYSTPTDRQYACDHLVDRAVGYGADGHQVDGTDLQACLETFQQAIAAARETSKPQLVVGKLLRLAGHGEHDDASYVDPTLRADPSGRDPIPVAESQVLESGAASQSDIELWRQEAITEVAEALSRAKNEPKPDAAQEDWRALASQHLIEGQPAE